MRMTLNYFQQFCVEKWFGDAEGPNFLVVPTLGLVGEAGEVAEKMKKFFRGDTDTIDREPIAMELGDVLFYAAVLADRLGYDLSEVARMEIDKIESRIERGTRRGSGDDR